MTALCYTNGSEIHIGDRINADGMIGTVMCVISSGEFCSEFSSEHWSYLEHGFMFRSDDGILIHYDYADEYTHLLSRGTPPN